MNVLLVDAMRDAVTVLARMNRHEGMDADSVEELMTDLELQRDVTRDVSTALARVDLQGGAEAGADGANMQELEECLAALVVEEGVETPQLCLPVPVDARRPLVQQLTPPLDQNSNSSSSRSSSSIRVSPDLSGLLQQAPV